MQQLKKLYRNIKDSDTVKGHEFDTVNIILLGIAMAFLILAALIVATKIKF